MKIDLAEYPLPKQYARQGIQCFLDPIREKLIPVSPEEIIRQKVVAYLMQSLAVPKTMIDVEVPMCRFESGAKGRADIIVFGIDSDGDKVPAMIIECKAPDVVIIDKHFDQVFDYDYILNADTVMITNGSELYVENYNWDKEEYETLKQAPAYPDLLAKDNLVVDDSGPKPFHRPAINDLESGKIDVEYKHDLIGEGTDPSLHSFIVNVDGFLMDQSDRLKPQCIEGVKIISDGGLRYTSFGNAAGGRWAGSYRYFIVEDDSGNNQLVSLTILAEMKCQNDPVFGNMKGYTKLIVAIDDYDKSHNSLQLTLDKYLTCRGKMYTIWHDGKLTSGNGGAASPKQVVEYIRRVQPDYVDNQGRIILGTLDNSRLITWQQPETKSFIGRLIKYALLRDKFREERRRE